MKKIKIIILFFFFVFFVERKLLINFLLSFKYKKPNFNIKSDLNHNKLIKNFKEDGLCSINLSKNETDLLLRWNNRFSFLKKINNNYFFNNIINNKNNIYFHSDSRILTFLFFPEVNYLINNTEICLLLHLILGDKFKIIDRIYTSKNFQKSKKSEVFSNFWHFDWRRIDNQWLRVMIYLSDQNNLECLQYFDKNLSKLALKNKLFNRMNHIDLPKYLKNKFISAEGKIGKVLIVNTADLLHRAGDPIKDKERKTFFVQIKSDKKWDNDDNYLKNPL